MPILDQFYNQDLNNQALQYQQTLDNFYLAIMYKSRKPASEEVYAKEKPAIETKLKDEKIADTWKNYTKKIQEKAGIVKKEE